MKIINGTHYDERTPDAVIRVLERARQDGMIVRLHYGDAETGRDRLEEHYVIGTVGRSGGTVKVPLLVPHGHNGGDAIRAQDIVKIRSGSGRVLYQHPNYHHGDVSLHPIKMRVDGRSYRGEVRVDGRTHARFDGLESARRWVRKMGLCIHTLAV